MPTLIVSAARAELAPRMAKQRIGQRSACMRLFDMWGLLGSGRSEHDARCNQGTIRRTSRGPGELPSGAARPSGGQGLGGRKIKRDGNVRIAGVADSFVGAGSGFVKIL